MQKPGMMQKIIHSIIYESGTKGHQDNYFFKITAALMTFRKSADIKLYSAINNTGGRETG
jgi:hypothetical protein